jgi:hypothetical protein
MTTEPVPPTKRSWWPYPPDSEELGRAQQVFVICSLLVWFVAGLAVTIYANVPLPMASALGA